MANERNIRDARYVSFRELEELADAVRQIDPSRLITASHAGDIPHDDLKQFMPSPTPARLFPLLIRRSPTPTKKSTAPASPTTASLVDMDGVRHRLPQAKADFLAGLVSARLDVGTTDHISLDPPYRVIGDEVDLALEPDELVPMHRGGTKAGTHPA